MKKAAGKKPVKKGNTLNEAPKRDKKTIIVLVIAALIFFGAFFSLHSEDILKDTNDIFWPYGDEIVEFEKAKVVEIVSEDIEYDELIENAAVGQQELSVIVKSGRYKGESMIVQTYFGAYYGVPVEVGDGVTLTIKTHDDGSHSAPVYEFNRIPILAVYLLLTGLIILGIYGTAYTGGRLIYMQFSLFTVLIHPVIVI